MVFRGGWLIAGPKQVFSAISAAAEAEFDALQRKWRAFEESTERSGNLFARLDGNIYPGFLLRRRGAGGGPRSRSFSRRVCRAIPRSRAAWC